MYQTLLSLCGLIALASAANRCVHARGKLECIARGADGYRGAQVALYDRDGVNWFFQLFDPDDRMGVTNVISEDGSFEVRGCGGDRDWLGSLYINEPEPYLKIFHFCNNEAGEDSNWRRNNYFRVFEPEIFDAGTITLDDLPPA